MYGYQAEEYSGGNGHSDYSHESGHNEFSYYPQQGGKAFGEFTPIFPQPVHPKRSPRAVEQDRAVALEQERAEITMAMFKLSIFTGHRAVAVHLASSYQLKAEED